MNLQLSTDEKLSLIFKELIDTKKLLLDKTHSSNLKVIWVPRNEVMEFFDYGDTRMGTLENDLVVSQVGNRKFYQRDSILSLLEANIVKV